MKKVPTASELDSAYDAAVKVAGENPNALGFLQGVKGSRYYRAPPKGCSDIFHTSQELLWALDTAKLAAHTGRW